MHAICEVLLDGDMRHPVQRILNFLSLLGSRQYPIGISRKILGNSAHSCGDRLAHLGH